MSLLAFARALSSFVGFPTSLLHALEAVLLAALLVGPLCALRLLEGRPELDVGGDGEAEFEEGLVHRPVDGLADPDLVPDEPRAAGLLRRASGSILLHHGA